MSGILPILVIKMTTMKKHEGPILQTEVTLKFLNIKSTTTNHPDGKARRVKAVIIINNE